MPQQSTLMPTALPARQQLLQATAAMAELLTASCEYAGFSVGNCCDLGHQQSFTGSS